ncbi:hypothetical protein WJ0W_006666 [Paenibacillus melissococcoides]|uniref:Uncharacterized protein n=1 Tax=Paenibacillus melissococcoides TaxID=2912268 RepID=A0ABM9GBJ2_9BACL|nr:MULTISPECIES: hypothetical protein [Paenibacillus]MEB9895723.1 hypothetical protein [Bacillus cereus]GIO82608.1 hypothetical protein J6TS7_62180 [Paenibacillus dendritiformis]CAH8249481.1 hypothetical protein WJ0W_006666 [Paenibacillus melissococcoides]CAH8721225.1 hypothetical protein HTL2_006252 [Paenibacillus melissococcoides]
MKKIIRTASMVLAFLMFFITTSQTYALTVHPDHYMQMQQTQSTYHQSQIFDDTSNDLFTRQKRFAPAIPWIGAGIGELLKWLGAAAALAYIGNEAYTLVTDIADALSTSKKKDKPLYFTAVAQSKLYIGKPLTFDEAKRWLKAKSYHNVWTPSKEAAKKIAESFSGRATGPEEHSKTGYKGTFYYWHYHDWERTVGHIFYGAESKEGKHVDTRGGILT